MKDSTLFLFKSFNDIDHISPLLWYALEKQQRVIILWFGKDDIARYGIIAPLIQKYSIQAISMNQTSRYKKWLCWNVLSCLIFLRRNKVKRLVSDWFNPKWKEMKGHLFFASRFLGIKTFALPHGYFVFTNDSFNQSGNSTEKTNAFSNRNKFHRYYLNHRAHRDVFLKRGLDKAICRINGNMRFSKKWHQKLMKDYFVQEGPTTKIIFFTPHWSYNVDKEETLILLNALIEKYSSDEFKIIEHTRGSGSLDKRIFSSYLYCDNALSGEIIKNTDIIISFGSSIIFEAILQQKHVINPRYLHSNSTLFDQYDAINSTASKQETMDRITKLISAKKEINIEQYQHIIQQHINLNRDEDSITSFYDQIFSSTN